MSEPVFSAAALQDVPALRALIESAYRGDSAKTGWTHEADMLSDARTNPEELSALIADPARVILMAHYADDLVGCVQVARTGDDLAYLGLLTVSPPLQAAGLGPSASGRRRGRGRQPIRRAPHGDDRHPSSDGTGRLV